MKLSNDIMTLINQMVAEGYIKKIKHPTYDLFAYKYTLHTVINGVWNDATRLCRGLILDSNGNVIAYPMKKFFNYEELKESEAFDIMSVPYQVSEKVDGSLGILVHYNDEYFISTQGSFTSDQAKWATDFLNKKYGKYLHNLDCDKYTYLFEIIYPENRIVIDYGDFADLIFLAMIDKETGEDIMLPDDIRMKMQPFKCVARRFELENKNFEELKSLNLDNKEGFVIHSSKGRLKIKFEKYFELHKAIFGLSNKSIWKMLIRIEEEKERLEKIEKAKQKGEKIKEVWLYPDPEYKTIEQYKESIPEELWDWYYNTINEFNSKVAEVTDSVREELSILHAALGEHYTQKEFALANLSRNKTKFAGLVFEMEAGRDIRKDILIENEPIGATYIK